MGVPRRLAIQVTRETGDIDDPELSGDLADDGFGYLDGIRQDADAILMIYHPEPEALAQAKTVIATLKGSQMTLEQQHLFGDGGLTGIRV